MKKIGQNIGIFLLLLGITYFQPIFFPFHQEKGTIPQEQEAPKVKTQTMKTLDTTSLAKYIQKPLYLFEKENGKVTYVATHHGEKWYSTLFKKGCLQLSVKQGKITSITIVGRDLSLYPFKLGMSLNALSSQVELMTNFKVKTKSSTYEIEIPEDKLLMTPCVKFKNNTYALLQFDRQGILQGIYYANIDKFLQNMPYRLENATLNIEQGVQNNQLLCELWQGLTHQNISTVEPLNQQAQTDLRRLMTVEDDEHKAMIQTMTEDKLQQAVTYPQKELERMINDNALLMMATHQDTQLALLQQFYDLNYQKQLQLKAPTHIGIAYQGAVTLIVKGE